MVAPAVAAKEQSTVPSSRPKMAPPSRVSTAAAGRESAVMATYPAK